MMFKKMLLFLLSVLLLFRAVQIPAAAVQLPAAAGEKKQREYIKWVDLTVTKKAVADVMEADIASHDGENPVSFVPTLACLAVRYGGDFKRYKKADLDAILTAYAEGKSFQEIASNDKLFAYYEEAYQAVFGGMMGEYDEVTTGEDGSPTVTHGYGMCLYSPIAQGFFYNHYDDFGASRSYGYRREHLGHDLMGSVGTPVVAIESGYVEACGWNRFGGWRIGIRSFDGRRYYYYAHLRRDHPYNDIYEGKTVYAGEVIGYLGMTGYSSKENVNNIDVPHLHYGLQLIFDPSQKDGTNQIWLDLYEYTNLLSGYRARTVRKDGESVSTEYKIPASAWD